MSLIRLENVSLARQGKTLLSGLNWTVEKGQTWAILGLNGAGKSTLLRLLTAEFFPSEGKAEILGYTFGNGDITGLRQHIGIVSSFNEIVPGHMNLDKITEAVKMGVAMAGGMPVVFPAIAVCDGIAMGHVGMKYSLVTRDLIAPCSFPSRYRIL